MANLPLSIRPSLGGNARSKYRRIHELANGEDIAKTRMAAVAEGISPCPAERLDGFEVALEANAASTVGHVATQGEKGRSRPWTCMKNRLGTSFAMI
jgi:hypothetical protein